MGRGKWNQIKISTDRQKTASEANKIEHKILFVLLVRQKQKPAFYLLMSSFWYFPSSYSSSTSLSIITIFYLCFGIVHIRRDDSNSEAIRWLCHYKLLNLSTNSELVCVCVRLYCVFLYRAQNVICIIFEKSNESGVCHSHFECIQIMGQDGNGMRESR